MLTSTFTEKDSVSGIAMGLLTGLVHLFQSCFAIYFASLVIFSFLYFFLHLLI